MARKLLLYLALIAGIVLCSGIFILIFSNSVEVHCLRESGSEPSCRITRKLMGRIPVSNRDVLGVVDVQVDETCDEGCSYRAELITSNGQSVPINDVYTDRHIVSRQVDAVDGFLSSSATSLDYTEPVQWWVVWMLAIMDLIGIAVVTANFLRGARSGT